MPAFAVSPNRVFREASSFKQSVTSFLAALFLTFHLGYNSLHLALESHGHQTNHSERAAGQNDFNKDDAGHEPHASDDHLPQFVSKSKVSLLVIEFVISPFGFSNPTAEAFVHSVPEPFKIPKESPPERFSPRGPPLA